MDGDGDDDLIIGTRWGYIAYFERLSDGTLAAPDTIFDLASGDNSQPLVTDWDNDGDLDLLVTGHGTPDLPIYLFISNGNLAESVKGSSPDTVKSPEMGDKDKYPTIAMADLDGDGLNDLVYAISCYDINIKNPYLKIRWYKNRGNLEEPDFSDFEYLSFDGIDSVDDDSETFKVPYITATDFNGDNIPDILIGASQQKLAVPQEQLVVYYGKRNNTVISTKIINSFDINIKDGYLIFNNNLKSDVKLSLRDVRGRMVIADLSVNNKFKIPNFLSKGLYIAEITMRKEKYMQSILLK